MYSARPNSGDSVCEMNGSTDSETKKFTFWGWNSNFWAEKLTTAAGKCRDACHARAGSRSHRRSRRGSRYHPLATGYGRP